MNRLHARYPFMSAARSAVEEAAVDLGEVVAERGAPVERGRERVERALLEGTVASETPRRWSDRAELLSYPVARVLVSLVDAPGAVEKYARAEAAAAYERLRDDLQSDDDLRSAGVSLSLPEFLTDFGLADEVTPVGTEAGVEAEEYRLGVAAYLPLATGLDGDRWRLVTRELDDGEVPVSREELYRLLRVAIRRRVEEGLPLSVPDEIGQLLGEDVDALRDALAEVDIARDIDTVVPGLFPPCMSALLDRARGEQSLPPHSEFALVSFLSSIGLDDEGMMALCGVNSPAGAEKLRYRVERLREKEGAQYAPPSCATMEAYGDCVNKDDLCAEISHPLEYYEERLDRADAPGDFRD